MNEEDQAERFRKARAKHKLAQSREETLYWVAVREKTALTHLVETRTGYKGGSPELLAELERISAGNAE